VPQARFSGLIGLICALPTAYCLAPAAFAQSLPASSPATGLDAALSRFAEGDYAGAEALLDEAVKDPAVDPLAWYYLGRAREARSSFKAAVAAYKRYLEIAPSAREAAALRLKLPRLEEKAAAEVGKDASGSQPTSAAAQADETEEPAPGEPRGKIRQFSGQAKIGHMSIAIGGMGTLAGLVFASVARSRAEFLEINGAFLPGDEPVDFDENFQRVEQEGKNAARASRALLITSGGLIAAGIALAVTAKKARVIGTQGLDASLSPIPGGVSVGVKLGF
jgi:tetratricopeptide (TPR) repeat protein